MRGFSSWFSECVVVLWIAENLLAEIFVHSLKFY
jgi:hypothetical protein